MRTLTLLLLLFSSCLLVGCPDEGQMPEVSTEEEPTPRVWGDPGCVSNDGPRRACHEDQDGDGWGDPDDDPTCVRDCDSCPEGLHPLQEVCEATRWCTGTAVPCWLGGDVILGRPSCAECDACPDDYWAWDLHCPDDNVDK